jgi:hypothetical protein
MRYEYKLETGEMTEQEDAPAAIEALPTPKVAQVSMRQARLALLKAGLLDAIDRHMSEPDQRIRWDYATTVERNNPTVVEVAASIGLSDEQVDSLFDLANTL